MNESAFPQVNIKDRYGILVPDLQTGMTLRDYFAAKAMHGLMDAAMPMSEIAAFAYQMADAMMKARGEK